MKVSCAVRSVSHDQGIPGWKETPTLPEGHRTTPHQDLVT